MALLVFLTFFFLTLQILSAIATLDMPNGLRFAFNVVGGISALVLPLLVYSYVDMKLTRRAVEAVARQRCQEIDAEFVRAELFKNHCALVCRRGNEKLRQRFRLRFVFSTWTVRAVEWLDE